MTMTNSEIVRDFKSAKNPWAQVEILADLNLCTKEAIVDILKNEGAISAQSAGQWKRGQKEKEATLATTPKAEEMPKPVEVKPDPVPAFVLNAVCEWLSDNNERYKNAKAFIVEYESVVTWFNKLGAPVTDND